MAIDLKIRVSYDNTELTIEPEKKDIVLTDETEAIHSVVWIFEAIDEKLAEGFHPSIRFEGVSSVSALGTKLYSGPFFELCHTPNTVIACGNVGIEAPYRYRAILENPIDGTVIESTNQGTISNEVLIEKPTVVRVSHDPTRPLLEVEPDPVTLVNGQTIQWEVVAEPGEIAAWYPRLHFLQGNPYFGPFTSMTVRDNTITASGSASSDAAPAPYNYKFQMVSVADGSVLFESSPDPVVDDEGDPSGTESPQPDDKRQVLGAAV